MTTRRLTLLQAAELMERHAREFVPAVERHFVEGAAKVIWPAILRTPYYSGLFQHLQKPSIGKVKVKPWPRGLRASGEPTEAQRGTFPRPADGEAEQLIKARRFGQSFHVANNRGKATTIEDLRSPQAYHETWADLVASLGAIGERAVRRAAKEVR